MRIRLHNRGAGVVFLSALFGVMLFTNLDAADFLLSWEASSDPSVTAYGIYQRIGDSDYEMIDRVAVEDLDDPARPSYRVTGLADGGTYWFAVSAFSGASTESDFFSQTCISVNGQVFECIDSDESGATVIISCFITAAGR
jgi:hypothetical protein